MVLPVHDVNPVRRTPVVTYALVATNIAVFLLTPAMLTSLIDGLSLAELCRLEAFYDRYAAIPREMLENQQLSVVATGGVADGGCTTGPALYEKNPALSVLYSMFLHGGWLHLLGNMLFLSIFGNNIEDRFGHLGFLGFYLLTGYIAAYGFALADPELAQPLIGASGAVSGALGAYFVLFPRVRVWSLVPVLLFLPLKLPAWLVLGTWFVLQWLYSSGYALSEAGSVAYLAHILGFLFGALISLPLRLQASKPPPRPPLYYRKEWR